MMCQCVQCAGQASKAAKKKIKGGTEQSKAEQKRGANMAETKDVTVGTRHLRALV